MISEYPRRERRPIGEGVLSFVVGRCVRVGCCLFCPKEPVPTRSTCVQAICCAPLLSHSMLSSGKKVLSPAVDYRVPGYSLLIL